MGGMNDQCGSYSAPSAIHRLSSSLCSGDSGFFALGGGITSSGSSEKIRSSMTLESTSPGTIAPDSTASSRLSRRRSALRPALSAPWQEKQFSTRIERMSLLKERPSAATAVADSVSAMTHAATHALPQFMADDATKTTNRWAERVIHSPGCRQTATVKRHDVRQDNPRMSAFRSAGTAIPPSYIAHHSQPTAEIESPIPLAANRC